MLHRIELPDKYWGEAIMREKFLQNRLPTKDSGSTPFELWYGYKPSMWDTSECLDPRPISVSQKKRKARWIAKLKKAYLLDMRWDANNTES